MSSAAKPLFFDGHNDALLNLRKSGGRAAVKKFATGIDGHVDLPKAQRGGYGGGFFAIFVPSPNLLSVSLDEMAKPAYDLPLPPQISQKDALPIVVEMASLLLQLETDGLLRICKTSADIQSSIDAGVMAAVMHLEGAEAIDPDFHALDVLFEAGLRSLGPVWSRPTIFGEGVPFRFPARPDVGVGLSELGKRLIKRCNEKRIMIDLSHLNEAGFWDVAELSDAPLVATHSNAHALCAHSRNLTDKQLDAIAESDGMVGLNFATAFLRQDGQMRSDVPITTMLRHIDYMISRLGEERVGIGSDFDGAQVPEAIGSAAGLGALRQAMRDHGYGEALVAKLAHGNWLRVLEKTWGA